MVWCNRSPCHWGYLQFVQLCMSFIFSVCILHYKATSFRNIIGSSERNYVLFGEIWISNNKSPMCSCLTNSTPLSLIIYTSFKYVFYIFNMHFEVQGYIFKKYNWTGEKFYFVWRNFKKWKQRFNLFLSFHCTLIFFSDTSDFT